MPVVTNINSWSKKVSISVEVLEEPIAAKSPLPEEKPKYETVIVPKKPNPPLPPDLIEKVLRAAMEDDRSS